MYSPYLYKESGFKLFAQRNVVWFNVRRYGARQQKDSIRYDDNSAKFFVLVVTKLLSSTITIAYADEKLPFFRHCQI